MKKLYCLSIAISLTLSVSVFSQEERKDTAKPATIEKVVRQVEDDYQRSIGILVEYIKLDHRTANKLIRKYGPQAASASELREELEQMIDANTAELVESKWLHTRSGQRSRTESVKEILYPTEYDPAEIPNNTSGVAPVEAKDPRDQPEADRQALAVADATLVPRQVWPMTNPNPTAFETRNLGFSIEADPVLGSDNKAIDLNIATEYVIQLEDYIGATKGYESTARGLEHLRMPTFYVMKDILQITTKSGNDNLIGLHTPPDDPDSRLLVMLRATVIVVK